MTITNLKQLIQKQLSDNIPPKEIKVYKAFIKYLEDLKEKQLNSDKSAAIEDALNAFVLGDGTLLPFKLFKKQVSKFQQFVQKEFQFVTQHYYMQLGVGVGMCFGVAFGSFSNMGLGISFGMFAGIIVGKFLDQKAKEEGRVLG